MDPPAPCDDDQLTRPDPCTLVLFGATGDLTRRKLIPALYSLATQDLLPERFAIVAFARRPKTDSEFRADLLQAVREHNPKEPIEDTAWQRFSQAVFYHRAELDDPGGYESLKKRLAAVDRELGIVGNRLFYLATPPSSFAEVVEHLGQAGLSKPAQDGTWARIVVEKPFGYDLHSARELNRKFRAWFAENQIYRIDHYLGKETVQNILVLRFANRLFELLWNHLYIESVRITVAETLGMEGRGGYFDRAGILRDMVQNHALQILTLVAMEPPVDLQPDSIRDEKVKVLRSIRPFLPHDIEDGTVRAQYASGEMDGRLVPPYREEEGVAPDSRTETYAAVRFWIDNWRWAGVPFTIRAGKRLSERSTDVVVRLKEVPDVLFARLDCSDVEPNTIRIRVQPDEGVEIRMSAKEPGPAMIVSPVRMHFDYKDAFGRSIPDAYERLLLNALQGEASLFARDDEVEAAWSLVTPILDAWRDAKAPLETYPAGSNGPAEAEGRLASNERVCQR